MAHINRQRYMAELSKLLTFVQKEDRQLILQHYNELLDNAEDEQAMLDSFGSPTKLAVTISRDYRRENPPEDIFNAPAEDAPVEETPVEEVPAEEAPVEEVPVEEAPVEEAPVEEAPVEEAPVEEVLSEPYLPATRKKTSVGLLILYLIFAIPIGLALLLIITAVNLIILAAAVSVTAAAVAGLGFAFSGITVLADILVVFGGSAVLLALAILLLWFSIWLIIISYRGLFRGITGLGRRICVREVSENG